MNLSRCLRSLSILTVIIATGVGACAADTSGESETTPKSAGPESGQTVINQYTATRGDAADAYQRAQTRLAPPSSPAPAPAGDSATSAAARGTLVLYDTTGPWGWLGELYAINVGSLVSHFGTWTAKPASTYVAGESSAYAGVVYVGSTFDEQLPTALLDDVLAGTRPVMWIGDNVWQLAARSASFATDYGFMPWIFDFGEVGRVDYKGTSLTRYLPNGAGIMTYSSLTTGKVLAQAFNTTTGQQIPWAVRGKNMTYIGENPMAYVTSNDRYLAFCDLLIETFAPATPERHRALVRIEDVSPMTSASTLRAIADYLSAQQVPFSVALIPFYRDPLGVENGGRPRELHIQQAPQVVSALKYMTTKGGSIVLHGYTHQYASAMNPYDAVSADDFEFYRAHIDAADYVVYDGPVAEDSQAWALGRIDAALNDVRLAGLPAPTVFEYPHYAGSAPDSHAIRNRFSTVYHRGLYFGGALSSAPSDRVDYTHPIGVVYPFVGTDIYGFKVLPETLGSYEPEAANHNPPRVVADLLATARANRVVRDGFASFYFHPYYPISVLKQLVTGIKAEGYTFVAPSTL